MALAEQQAALARLYTDAAVREQLRGNRAAFATQFHLSIEETEALSESVLAEASDFASSLLRKRFQEAARAMPEIGELLGVRFGTLFFEYAARTLPTSTRNPALEAAKFIDWLLTARDREWSLWERDILTYGRCRIAMEQSARRWMIRWLCVPGSGPSRSIVVWWRSRGRLRSWRWG